MERKVHRDCLVTREPPAPPVRRELLGRRVRKVRRDSLVTREQLGPPVRRELLVRRDLPGLRDQSHWEQ
jgi:hypothetical protein